MQYKRIKLTQYKEPNPESIYTDRRKYSVHYNHMKFRLFNNKVECLEFLKELSEFLNSQLFQIVNIQIELYGMFKKAYAFFNTISIDTILELISSNEKLHYRLLNRFSNYLGNSDKTSSLLKMANNLERICLLFMDTFGKNQKLITYELKRILEQLNGIKKAINDY